MIERVYDKKMKNKVVPGKVVVIYGPRRVGKTTLITEFLRNYDGNYFLGTGEDRILREILESEDIKLIKSHFANYSLVVIDEAQHVSNIGLGLKIIVDHLPGLKVIASGSSSFDLSNKLGEPLTGRQKIMTLYPIAYSELFNDYGGLTAREELDNLMIYGSYPEVVTSDSSEEKIEYLQTLVNSYLFRDILELENIKNPSKLGALLRLIAFQIGHEVSYNELSNALGLAKQTVERYLDLLEKSFIITKLPGFSRNLRKEITKNPRYYFCDNGIRNALINNFNVMGMRDDQGMLWENFLVSERIKRETYQPIFSNNYFWRTYDRQEVDWVEDRNGKLYAYEFKWGAKRARVPKAWKCAYPDSEFHIIDKTNFHDFVLVDAG